MTRTVCFTSFTWGYLARARILSRTLRAAHPDWLQAALIVDAPTTDTDTALATFDRVVFAPSLGVPDFASFIFRHTLVEACTALKPRMLAHLLDGGADAVIYLDPDIAVFHPLASVEAALEAASIVLTPHQHQPNHDAQAFHDAERTAQLYGVYNLGFAAVRHDATGRAFAAWWQERCETDCRDAPAEGLFTDQRYGDLVPALFPRVAILRDPGCNVASWNLSRRVPVVTPEGCITVDSHRLAFYHFSKIGDVGDIMTRRYAQNEVPLEITAWWQRQVAAATIPGLADRPWAWGCFADGAPIPLALRRAWRQDASLRIRFDNPFASGPDSLQDWARRERPHLMVHPDLPTLGEP